MALLVSKAGGTCSTRAGLEFPSRRVLHDHEHVLVLQALNTAFFFPEKKRVRETRGSFIPVIDNSHIGRLGATSTQQKCKQLGKQKDAGFYVGSQVY